MKLELTLDIQQIKEAVANYINEKNILLANYKVLPEHVELVYKGYAEEPNLEGVRINMQKAVIKEETGEMSINDASLLKEMLLEIEGDFTFDHAGNFLIETMLGNFTWTDPEYGGDNTIKPFNGSYAEWLKYIDIPCGRRKGKHILKKYCGEEFKVEL